MKKNVLTLVALMLVGLAFATSIDLPKKVKSSFTDIYGNLKSVQWDQTIDGEFEASFEHDGMNKIAIFSQNGKWIYTRATLTDNDLWDCMEEAIDYEYDSYDLYALEYYEAPKMNPQYRVTIVITSLGRVDDEIDDEEDTEVEVIENYIRLTFDECDLITEEEIACN